MLYAAFMKELHSCYDSPVSKKVFALKIRGLPLSTMLVSRNLLNILPALAITMSIRYTGIVLYFPSPTYQSPVASLLQSIQQAKQRISRTEPSGTFQSEPRWLNCRAMNSSLTPILRALFRTLLSC